MADWRAVEEILVGARFRVRPGRRQKRWRCPQIPIDPLYALGYRAGQLADRLP